MSLQHPYLPASLDIPHYTPNERPLTEILGYFFSTVGIAVIALWLYTGRIPHLKTSLLARCKVSWFFVCGLIHFILEGYFAVYHEEIAGMQTFLGQLWKEYGKGDSRYMTSDTFTVCMETITAFVDGPLCFWVTIALIANSPNRYVVQMMVSLFQLYGDVLYFMTEAKEDFSHGPKGHPLYFWFYFVFMNAIWIVLPALCIVESFKELSSAQKSHDQLKDNSKKRK
ncbi:hypothetical protein CAPTEDRAFT_171071 [Capitella teleta]|uniref:EXPERA domain-containing protein n=1 Tax=Capitella teleta TaxID=283909 RepID=R7TNS7_CAPTE|nr:hypothetical protein CAPTEDRAFT_171071 [Capitella teleta]|eukprot:ELT92715.1 hypothetical protein CAPTEDRAFT_171071 [Capitella teleta]